MKEIQSIIPISLRKLECMANNLINMVSLHSCIIAYNNKSIYYYCHAYGSDAGQIIHCDNKDRAVEWLHLKCQKIRATSIPKDK